MLPRTPEPGYPYSYFEFTGYANRPSLRLLGSWRNDSGLNLCPNQRLIDQHSQAKTFLLKLLREVAQQMNLRVETATDLEMKLLVRQGMRGIRLRLSSTGSREVQQLLQVREYFRKGVDDLISALRPRPRPIDLDISLGRLQKLRLDVMRMSAGIRAVDTRFFHPQSASTFDYIVFHGRQSGIHLGQVAVQMGGKWRRKDRVLIGFVDQETDWDKVGHLHPADVGFFYSLRSHSIVGMDGTNYAWTGDTGDKSLPDGWGQQWTEKGCDEATQKLNVGSLSRLCQLDTFDENAYICVKLTLNLEFDVYMMWPQHCYEWVKVGRVSWRSGPKLPEGKAWCPAIVFMPRAQRGPPQCAVRPMHDRINAGRGRGRGRGGRNPNVDMGARVAQTPYIRVVRDAEDWPYRDMPEFLPKIGQIVWDNPPTELCKSLGTDFWQLEIKTSMTSTTSSQRQWRGPEDAWKTRLDHRRWQQSKSWQQAVWNLCIITWRSSFLVLPTFVTHSNNPWPNGWMFSNVSSTSTWHVPRRPFAWNMSMMQLFHTPYMSSLVHDVLVLGGYYCIQWTSHEHVWIPWPT